MKPICLSLASKNWMSPKRKASKFFRSLGQLRKSQEALRLGDIQFFTAGDKHLGFTRTYGGKMLRVYCNRSADPWEIPTNRLYFGMNMKVIAKDHLTIGARGFCVTEVV